MSDLIVKNLSFGKEASNKVFLGAEKLALAVGSTLGASGKCVLMEDSYGNPMITKDGVTIADSIVLLDPVENMGANLIREAARKTVREAGDGTTTATVLAHAILKNAYALENSNEREVKNSINSMTEKVVKYLEDSAIKVDDAMLDQIATIATNNDVELGKLIGDAFRVVNRTGVVIMEETEDADCSIEIVEGIQCDMGLTNAHFITNKETKTAELDNPLVLLVESPIDTIKQIEAVLTYVIKNNKPLLIIGDVEPKIISTLAMNKAKNNIKVNVIDAPVFGVNRKETFDDIALLTGATIINEDLGDDLDLIQPDMLGTCLKSITSYQDTVLQIKETNEEVNKIVNGIKKKLIKEKAPNVLIKLEKRLARLTCKVAVVKVGANSPLELKEKSDRVEDAICATKAAVKEGVIPGGGVALLNASHSFIPETDGEKVLLESIRAPYFCILDNAGMVETRMSTEKGVGYNVITGESVLMVKHGIIDPLLVTKSALINAVSVATTILSTNCVINNLRVNEGNR